MGVYFEKYYIVCIFNSKENVTKISILSLYILVLEDSFQKKPISLFLSSVLDFSSDLFNSEAVFFFEYHAWGLKLMLKQFAIKKKRISLSHLIISSAFCIL